MAATNSIHKVDENQSCKSVVCKVNQEETFNWNGVELEWSGGESLIMWAYFYSKGQEKMSCKKWGLLPETGNRSSLGA